MTNKTPHFDESGRFIHPCSISDCPRDGTHGIGVFLLKGNLGQWFCARHYKEHEKSEQRYVPTGPLPQSEKQGRLF